MKTCTEQYPLAEIQDYEQVEAFLKHQLFGLELVHTEYRVGSYRHKICGSIDAIYRTSDGTWVIVDWKRSMSIFESDKEILRDIYAPGLSKQKGISCKFYVDEEGMYGLNYAHICKSDTVYTYMIQLAVYRKLCILNGNKVSKEAYLVVFHPSFPTYRILRVHLDKKCKAGAPIEVVNWIFAQREAHLKQYFSSHKS